MCLCGSNQESERKEGLSFSRIVALVTLATRTLASERETITTFGFVVDLHLLYFPLLSFPFFLSHHSIPMTCREDYVYLAKVAEQAERYEGN